MKKKVIYVFLCNHFDLAWPRKFESVLVDKGLTYIPYAAIQEYYIKDNMALCERDPEFRFNIESVAGRTQVYGALPGICRTAERTHTPGTLLCPHERRQFN